MFSPISLYYRSKLKLATTNIFYRNLLGSKTTMNDTPDTESAKDTMILTEVPSGTICKLVGVVRPRHGRFHGKRGHHHKGSGFFTEFRERWEQHKQEHRWSQGEDTTGSPWDYELHGPHHMRGMRTLRRLLDLGITKGCTLIVVQGSSNGPVLLQVRGTRVALGQGLAGKMLVEVVGHQ